MNINRTLKLSFVLLVVMVLSMAIYGFAASNSVDPSAAGDGQAAISGYTISAIHYNLDAADASKIASMTFTISPAMPATGSVQVKLLSSSTSYTSCTVASGTNVTCTFTGGISVLSADQLRVIAAQ